MRVSPVNFIQHNSNQNFKGILKFSHNDSYDDNAQEVMVDIDYYDYYPFKDESKEEIESKTQPLDKTEYQPRPYPSWSTLSGKQITVKPPLSITQAQYNALKTEYIDDEFIVKTFA